MQEIDKEKTKKEKKKLNYIEFIYNTYAFI